MYGQYYSLSLYDLVSCFLNSPTLHLTKEVKISIYSGILGGSDSGVMEDDQIVLDPNSNLGMFLRRCVLAFNVLSFEVL